MQITGYTTQEANLNCELLLAPFLSPKPNAGDATERNRSNVLETHIQTEKSFQGE